MTTEPVSIRQSRLHPRLFVAKGNAFEPEQLGADGLLALVSQGFSGLLPSYHAFCQRPSSVLCSEYVYNTHDVPTPKLSDFEGIVHPRLDDLVRRGATTIVVPPMRCSDPTLNGHQKDQAIAATLVSWLNRHPSLPVKLILTDFAVLNNCYDSPSL